MMDQLIACHNAIARDVREYKLTPISDHFVMPEDLFLVMSFSFVHSQLSRLKSIRLLMDAGQDEDAGQIARSMLEGAMLLEWASRDKSTRSQTWFAFEQIEKGRLDEIGRKYQIDIPVTEPNKIKEFFDLFGNLVLRKEENREVVNFSDKNIRIRWYAPKTIHRIFNETRFDFLYETWYGVFSNWIHWNPVAILSFFTKESSGAGEPLEEDIQFVVAILSCQLYLLKLTEHLKLDYSERIMMKELMGQLGN